MKVWSGIVQITCMVVLTRPAVRLLTVDCVSRDGVTNKLGGLVIQDQMKIQFVIEESM